MNSLYPIIRRKRRPLIVAESVPDRPPSPVVVGSVEPVNAVATKPVEPVASDSKPQASDDQDTSTVEA